MDNNVNRSKSSKSDITLWETGYLRVAAASPSIQVADPQYNIEEMIKIIEAVKEKQIDVLVFPELSVTGYTCGDLFHQSALYQAAESALLRLIEHTTCCYPVIVAGIPVRADNQLFNCAAVIHRGKLLGVVPKTFIPGYKEFYEERWFSPAHQAMSDEITLCGATVPFGWNILFQFTEHPQKATFSVEICEDLWVPIPPSSYHCMQGAMLTVNLSASNEIIGKHEYRSELVRQQSARCLSGYVYASSGPQESTTDLVFGGHSLISECGNTLAEAHPLSVHSEKLDYSLIMADIDIERIVLDRIRSTTFMENIAVHSEKTQMRVVSISGGAPESAYTLMRYIDPHPFVPSNHKSRDKRCEEIFSIQVSALAKRMRHTFSKTAVIGISGGLDSTLALLVAAKTFDLLGRDRREITAITMPGFGTTGRTYNNALELMRHLNVSSREIDIKPACIRHFEDIGHDMSILDVTYENVQARERTQILMDIANKQGGMVIGTGDLSELALGWATYNGDHMSMYGVNCSIPKTLVRYLVQWVAENMVDTDSKAILLDILDTPVSPELLPASENDEIQQKTEDIVGPYQLHDFFIYQTVRFGFAPKKVLMLAELAFKDIYTRGEILRVMNIFYRRFITQQFKRSCLPDGPKVGTVSLSPRGDWRMPSDASAQLWLKQLEELI